MPSWPGSRCSSGRPLSIADVVEQVGGLQTQYAPSGYVGLWTRLAGLPARRPDRGARGARGRPGDADAGHDPYRVASASTGATRSVSVPRDASSGDGRGPGRPGSGSLSVEARGGRPASGPRRRTPDRQGARRPGVRLRRHARAVGRPRARATERDVGAPPCRPAGARRGLGRPARHLRGGRSAATSSAHTCVRSGRRTGADIASWAGITMTAAKEAAAGLDAADLSETRQGASWSTCPTSRYPTPTCRRRCGSCRTGTPTCSSMRGGPGCCPRRSVHACSRRRTRSRSARTSSTAASPVRWSLRDGRIELDPYDRPSGARATRGRARARGARGLPRLTMSSVRTVSTPGASGGSP